MDKHDLQQIRRVSNALRKYAPHIGEQELSDILCDFGAGLRQPLPSATPYLGEEIVRLLYNLVWYEGYTVAQILDPAAASQAATAQRQLRCNPAFGNNDA